MANSIPYETFKVTPPIEENKGAPRLYPNTPHGLIDIIGDYAWTLTPREGRQETPSIELVEYSLKNSALMGAFTRYAFASQNLTNNGGLPYYGLYPADKTGFWYSFPYFADAYRSISNSWESADALSQLPLASRIPIIGEYTGMHGLEALAKAWSVGVGHEVPLGYTGTNRETLEIVFVLNNTVSIHDIQRNWEFIYLFSYQNSQNRKNYIIVDPPKFYVVRVEGAKYSPAMMVSNLVIGNLGQIKRISLKGRIHNIPEAWSVRISLTDLIPHSQNMLEAMRDGNFDNIEATQNKTVEEILTDLGFREPTHGGGTEPLPGGGSPSTDDLPP